MSLVFSSVVLVGVQSARASGRRRSPKNGIHGYRASDGLALFIVCASVPLSEFVVFPLTA